MKLLRVVGCTLVLVATAQCTKVTEPDADAGPSTTDAGTSITDAGTSMTDAGTLDGAPISDAAGLLDSSPSELDGNGVDAGTSDAATGEDHASPTQPDPILFVHGINGSDADFAVMVERFVADGWPRERLMARTFENPGFGCNVDNAVTLATWAAELMATTGSSRVDVVAHSMGSLSSRHWVKNLGGTAVVNTYVTLGGMNHGLSSPCLSPLNVCVWKELCSTGEFVASLNAPPAAPPPTQWVAIYSDGDDRVPVTSAPLDGAENIMVAGLEHDGPMGLQDSPVVYEQVKRVVLYPGH